MAEPREPSTSTAVAEGVLRRRWAPATLRALASGPMRYRDLLAVLGSTSDSPVHTRTMLSAVEYLAEHSFITIDRSEHGPRTTWYTITELGRRLLAILDELNRAAGRDTGEPDGK